jgi:predicted DNA repair protein MutK
VGQAAFGRGLVASAPWLMKFLSVAGTIAMFLVGGGILVHNVPALHHAVQALGGEGQWGWLVSAGQHGGGHHRRRHRAGGGDRVPEAARQSP